MEERGCQKRFKKKKRADIFVFLKKGQRRKEKWNFLPVVKEEEEISPGVIVFIYKIVGGRDKKELLLTVD